MAFGHAREADELAAVAASGDDERSAADDIRVSLAPKGDAGSSQFLDQRLGGLGLAVGREHCAGKSARRADSCFARRLPQRHVMAAARKLERLPKAENAGADHSDVELGHVLPSR